MTNQKQPPESTPETKREQALENLTKRKELLNLAIYCHAKEDIRTYGDEGISALEAHLYEDSLKNYLNSDKQSVYDMIVASRANRKAGTGAVNLSEDKIINDCYAIIQQSLLALQVKDILGLIEYKGNVKGKENKYLSDLAQSKNEEDKKLAGILVGSYLQYMTSMKVGEALIQSAKSIPKGLEQILTSEKDKKLLAEEINKEGF